MVSTSSGQSGDFITSTIDDTTHNSSSSMIDPDEALDVLPLLRGSSGLESSKQRNLRKDMNGDGVEQNLVFRFNLRMFWREGYCWQEEA